MPDGTVVKDADGRIVVDLVGEGSEHVIARGGRGGLGNKALSSPRRKAPGFALLGEPGDVLDITLELKSLPTSPSSGSRRPQVLARVGAVRRPAKIADYPFTTLVPNLGVVTAGDERYTVADVPGLIPAPTRAAGWGSSSCATSSAARSSSTSSTARRSSPAATR